MTATSLLEGAAGVLLLFFLPGYATTRALFPEWRVRGSEAWRRAVEIVTLSFVLSVTWTILLGYLLLSVAPGGFQPFWTNPLLEGAQLVVTVGGLLTGWWLGAYASAPPERWSTEAEPGGEGAWELTRRLDQLAHERRRLEHELRQADASSGTAATLRDRIEGLREESSRLTSAREREYAQ
jgi:hypothetical protein